LFLFNMQRVQLCRERADQFFDTPVMCLREPRA